MKRVWSGLIFCLFISSRVLAANTSPLGFAACSNAVHGDTKITQMPIEGGQVKFSGDASKLSMNIDQRCTGYVENSEWKCQICRDKGTKQSRGWVASYSFRTFNAMDVMPFGFDKDNREIKALIEKGDDGEMQVLYRLHTKHDQEGMTFNLACSVNGKGITEEELKQKDARGLCSALKSFGVNVLLRPQPADVEASAAKPIEPKQTRGRKAGRAE